MWVFRFRAFLRDLLLRVSATTYSGPAMLQYVNGGTGNDNKLHKRPRTLEDSSARVKMHIDIFSFCLSFVVSCIYIHIYVYFYMCVYVYMYILIYIYT